MLSATESLPCIQMQPLRRKASTITVLPYICVPGISMQCHLIRAAFMTASACMQAAQMVAKDASSLPMVTLMLPRLNYHGHGSNIGTMG